MQDYRPALAIALFLGAAACATPPAPVIPGQMQVMASRETEPAGAKGDAADDPALWQHPSDASQSLILATNKQEGLVVYRLDGSEAQRLPIGLINNVDVRQSADRNYDVAVASNDQVNAISIFHVGREDGAVIHAGDVTTGKEEPYGICQAREKGRDYAGVTYKDGTLQIWEIDAGTEQVSGTLSKTIKLETQLEGCVFDETAGTIFIGEENAGLWVANYRDDAPSPVLIDSVSGPNGLVADVEGVSIWKGANGTGWVVASAQQDNRFVVYERKAPYAPRGSFSIGANETAGIDEVTHTDGLDVFAGALPDFPRGILIVQDDGNPRSGQDQNFKIVNWADIEQALNLPQLDAE